MYIHSSVFIDSNIIIYKHLCKYSYALFFFTLKCSREIKKYVLHFYTHLSQRRRHFNYLS